MVVSVLQVPAVTRTGTGPRLNAEPGCKESISGSAWPLRGRSDPHQIGKQLPDFLAAQERLCVTHLHITDGVGSYSWIKGTPLRGKRTMEPH